MRTALIVGLPGETEEDFEDLLGFVREQRFERLGVFTYSQEEGTAAAEMDGQLPERVKKARQRKVMALQQRISRAEQKALVGQRLEVLVEGKAEGTEHLLVGRHARQAPEIDGVTYINAVRLPGEKVAYPGEIVTVEITEAGDYDLVGKVVAREPRRGRPAAPGGAGARAREALHPARDPVTLEHVVRRPESRRTARPWRSCCTAWGPTSRTSSASRPSSTRASLVVSARAPHEAQPMGYSWFDIDWSEVPPRIDFQQVVESRDAILRFVGEAAEAHGADPSRVWLVGFSQGASMADGLRAGATGAAPRHRGPLRAHRPACGPGRSPPRAWRASRCSGSTAGPTRWCRSPSATRRATSSAALGLRLDYREYPIGHEISEESLRDMVTWLSARSPSHRALTRRAADGAPTPSRPIPSSAARLRRLRVRPRRAPGSHRGGAGAGPGCRPPRGSAARARRCGPPG